MQDKIMLCQWEAAREAFQKAMEMMKHSVEIYDREIHEPKQKIKESENENKTI